MGFDIYAATMPRLLDTLIGTAIAWLAVSHISHLTVVARPPDEGQARGRKVRNGYEHDSRMCVYDGISQREQHCPQASSHGLERFVGGVRHQCDRSGFAAGMAGQPEVP